LAEFLDSLSEEEISRFKKAEDLKQMITNLATIKSENNKTTRIAELESLDSHVIESMFKRYIDNA
ncbi:glutamyl-tRNA reductase, partial [Gammaproteobacteria bacterium]|nr:glutamyl-tRNA reductase [Gammaproteobacteria bacterium]